METQAANSVLNMSFQSTDIGFFFAAGGGPGSLRDDNLGGAISASEIQTSTMFNFCPDIPRSVLGNVGERGTWSLYFPYYLKNKNATTGVNKVSQWIYRASSDTNIGVQIGKDPAGLNGTAQTIADQTVKPTGVTFSSVNTDTTDTNTYIDALDHGQYYPFWCRVYGNKGLASKPKVTFGIKVKYFVNSS